jgi:hypothetical protein
MTTDNTAFAQVNYTNGYEFTEGSGYTLPEYPFVSPPELHTDQTLRHAVVIVGGGLGLELGGEGAVVLGLGHLSGGQAREEGRDDRHDHRHRREELARFGLGHVGLLLELLKRGGCGHG